MRSFCCGSISTKRSVRGARCHSASSFSAASCSPVSIERASSPTASAMCAVTWRLSPLITLMAMPSRARFSNRLLRLGLRRIEEHQKAAKDHVSLVLAVVVGPRGNAARSKRQNAETLRTLGLEDRLEFGARGVIHRHLRAVAVERGADVQHVRERPLGDEQVAVRVLHSPPPRWSAGGARSRRGSRRSWSGRRSSAPARSPAATMAASSGFSMPVSRAALT